MEAAALSIVALTITIYNQVIELLFLVIKTNRRNNISATATTLIFLTRELAYTLSDFSLNG